MAKRGKTKAEKRGNVRPLTAKIQRPMSVPGRVSVRHDEAIPAVVGLKVKQMGIKIGPSAAPEILIEPAQGFRDVPHRPERGHRSAPEVALGLA
jgi:hypothetical protein